MSGIPEGSTLGPLGQKALVYTIYFPRYGDPRGGLQTGGAASSYHSTRGRDKRLTVPVTCQYRYSQFPGVFSDQSSLAV